MPEKPLVSMHLLINLNVPVPEIKRLVRIGFGGEESRRRHGVRYTEEVL